MKAVRIRKPLFTVLGSVELVDGKKRFVPASIPHFNAVINRYSVGKKLKAEFVEYRYQRSSSQLRYHMVLCGYIADYTGHTVEEIHDWAMRAVFGVKTITIAGKSATVRRSFADIGDVEKYEAVELIEFDLAVCADLEIRVPSAAELGYSPL